MAFCVTSRDAFSLAIVISCHHFLANYVMHNLALSFFFYATTLSSFSKSRARHSKGHVSKIVKMALSVAINGSFIHCFVVSLHALMYTLRMLDLNFVKLCKLLYTIGDRRGLRLIHFRMLISMSTQKILASQIRFMSFVA